MFGTDIAKAYEPAQVEQRWYQAWLDAHAFAGVADPAREPFCIVIPPPNVTGVLHMGHVLNNTIQDILIRRARQEGKAALWLPGTDHAGLATQTQVEKDLRKQGLDRRKLGRDVFFQRVVEWRDKHGGIIISQLKRLGCSCDWDRTVHTLDPAYSRAVLTAFVKLYEGGYIYRGKRMVNWCPASQTALSDEEVIPKPQKGSLYHMRYEIVERPGEFINIATTRPETLMGDTAVAVHPEDPRYAHLRGAHVWRPFPRAQIPIIFDTAADKDFGSGALKVTPAHDKVDFEIGQRHQLPIIEVIDASGKLNELAGEEFKGMDRFKARKVAAEKLKELGLLIKEEPYENNVGFSERADVPIEPRLSEQWFLKYPRIGEAKTAVRDGYIKFRPEYWNKVYLNWLDKIQDWCISRQVWWGHRIPVWYKKGADRNDAQNRHVSVDGPPDPQNWEQDEDSLDTWASSWLWPFGTLGWPAPTETQTKELAFWYPTSDLVTGPDIIFFWVARMIIAGLEFMNADQPFDQRLPFKNVYFTGIVRDKQGRKMSKTLGNSPDPIELINKFGADGLRFGTMSSASQGNDVLFDEANVELGRNFCNKLWNAVRFRKMQGPVDKNGNVEQIIARLDPNQVNSDDQAILRVICERIDEIKQRYASYDFSIVTQLLYSFFWGDYCDWYLETAKARVTDESKAHILAVQDLCLRQFLLLLHPFMPFITEELWHSSGFGPESQLIQDINPGDGRALRAVLDQRGLDLNSKAVEESSRQYVFVREARALKARFKLEARRDVQFILLYPINTETEYLQNLFRTHSKKLMQMIGASVIQDDMDQLLHDMPSSAKATPSGTSGAAAASTPFGSLILVLPEVDKEAERSRIRKELEVIEARILGLKAKLMNKEFTDKAPTKVVEGARAQLTENELKANELLTFLRL